MKPTKLKIVTDKEVQVLVKKWKAENQRVVFTNGCFDILHLGHVDYLEKSRLLGDKLIVAVNSDTSVKALKGETRPINDEFSRSRILASLDFVDAVIVFSDETPKRLIEMILPDVLVKGKDYEINEIAGADAVLENGGQVERITMVEGYSTSNTISKIKKLEI